MVARIVAINWQRVNCVHSAYPYFSSKSVYIHEDWEYEQSLMSEDPAKLDTPKKGVTLRNLDRLAFSCFLIAKLASSEFTQRGKKLGSENSFAGKWLGTC